MTLPAATHKVLVMTAQILLSAIFIVGYFYLMAMFLHGQVKVPGEYKDMFTALLGVLTAGVGTILAFWFSRSRDTSESQ